jgi:hypothetical protein
MKRGPLPAGTYPPEPLAVGSTAPSLKAPGFVNGLPPSLSRETHPLMVLDIWAHW